MDALEVRVVVLEAAVLDREGLEEAGDVPQVAVAQVEAVPAVVEPVERREALVVLRLLGIDDVSFNRPAGMLYPGENPF